MKKLILILAESLKECKDNFINFCELEKIDQKLKNKKYSGIVIDYFQLEKIDIKKLKGITIIVICNNLEEKKEVIRQGHLQISKSDLHIESNKVFERIQNLLSGDKNKIGLDLNKTTYEFRLEEAVKISNITEITWNIGLNCSQTVKIYIFIRNYLCGQRNKLDLENDVYPVMEKLFPDEVKKKQVKESVSEIMKIVNIYNKKTNKIKSEDKISFSDLITYIGETLIKEYSL